MMDAGLGARPDDARQTTQKEFTRGFIEKVQAQLARVWWGGAGSNHRGVCQLERRTQWWNESLFPDRPVTRRAFRCRRLLRLNCDSVSDSGSVSASNVGHRLDHPLAMGFGRGVHKV